MSEVNVQIQNPKQTVNINNPSIVIEVAEQSIEVEFSEQNIEIQVQNPVIEVNIGGPFDCGDGGGGHEIQDEGTPITQRGALNFVGAGVAVTDDSANNRTVVTIPGGGGTWGSITGTLSDQTDLQTALDGKVDENAVITGATKTKITYDAKGLVTAGADAGIADITGLQTALDGKAASSHTHPLADITDAGALAALNAVDAAEITNDAVTNEKAANMAAWMVKGRNNAASGDPQDIGVADLTEEATPAAGDMLFGWESGGALRKFDIGNLPGGPGGASYTEITYAAMQTAITNATLTPGGWYLITDAAGTDLGFLTYAVTENSISVAGVGGYLNADFQAVGVYDGVETITGVAAGTQQGIWRTGFEALTINYTNQSGGTFAAGDTITGGTTGAEATVVNDDGAGAVIAYMTSAGIAFDSSEVLDNGNGVTADMTGIELPPTLALGDIVIWNLLHWQLTDDTLLNGEDPENNTAAYTQLLKTDADQGYITAWDESEYDFGNDTIIYRQDLRGNLVRGNTGVVGFQWGRDVHDGNNIQSPNTFDTKNLLSTFRNNTTYPGADVSDIVTGVDTLIENNILENGAQLTGITAGENCNIGSNVIGARCIVGGGTVMEDEALFIDNVLRGNSSFVDCIIGRSSSVSRTIMYSGANIYGLHLLYDSGRGCGFFDNVLIFGVIDTVSVVRSNVTKNHIYGSMLEITTGIDALIENNILENGAQLTGIAAGENCSISRNKVGQGAILGGSTTMGDGAEMNDLEIRANKSIANKELDAGVTFSDKVIQVTADEAETLSDNVDGNRSQPGYSDIPATIDIAGLTTLDCTAAFAQYRGIYNITSSNATEAIDQIDNPPTQFPFPLRPAAGLVLTITGTAYAGIAAGQIALKAASYSLDGDKGEYIILEIDPLGTGALIEKQVVNGLI